MRGTALVMGLLAATVALTGCQTAPVDGDDDGLMDQQETIGWIVTVHLVDRVLSYHVTSDPGQQDEDGDGLYDVEEYLNGLDPHKNDTDGDGLTDCQETTQRDRAKCEARDFDCDQEDCSTGTNPLDADSDAQASRYVRDIIGWTGPADDLAGDGIQDGDELAGYDVRLADGTSWHVVTDPRRVDTDGDGLHDGEERFVYRTNAALADTDGDGCPDGQDPFPRRTPEHQSYEVGLDTLTLHHDADDDGSGEIGLRVIWGWADEDWTLPASGSLSMAAGETRPLASYEPAGAHAACPDGFSTVAPWVPVFVLVGDEDGGRLLDITGAGPGAASFWWNLHTGRFSRGDTPGEGVATEGPVELAGSEATVRLWPRVVADEAAVQVS